MSTELNLRGVIKVGLTATPDTVVTCQVTGLECVPTQQTATSPATACAAQQTVVTGASSWALSFSYKQDWGNDDSLSEFMFDNDGQGPAFFEYTPADTDVPMVSGEFTPTAGPFGGAAASTFVATGTMPMPGAPTFTPQA